MFIIQSITTESLKTEANKEQWGKPQTEGQIRPQKQLMITRGHKVK